MGLLLIIHCLFLVSLAVGSYVKFLVLCVVLGIISIVALALLNASCNIDMI